MFLTGVDTALGCLLSLGLGLLVRHAAGAIAAVIGVFLVLPAIVGSLPGSLPDTIGNRRLVRQDL